MGLVLEHDRLARRALAGQGKDFIYRKIALLKDAQHDFAYRSGGANYGDIVLTHRLLSK